MYHQWAWFLSSTLHRIYYFTFLHVEYISYIPYHYSPMKVLHMRFEQFDKDFVSGIPPAWRGLKTNHDFLAYFPMNFSPWTSTTAGPIHMHWKCRDGMEGGGAAPIVSLWYSISCSSYFFCSITTLATASIDLLDSSYIFLFIHSGFFKKVNEFVLRVNVFHMCSFHICL